MPNTNDRRGFICKLLGGAAAALIRAKEAKDKRDARKQKPSAEVEINPRPGDQERQGLSYPIGPGERVIQLEVGGDVCTGDYVMMDVSGRIVFCSDPLRVVGVALQSRKCGELANVVLVH